MPNWVINKVRSSPEVIKHCVTDNRIDFNNIVPANFPYDPEGIDSRIESIVKEMLGIKTYMFDHSGLSVRDSFRRLSKEQLDELFLFMQNYHQTGYVHAMDFTRDAWGTKWNACDSVIDLYTGSMKFETAWSTPLAAMIALSKKYPDDAVSVIFADEDLGSNCGQYVLLNGEFLVQNIAPSYRSMDASERENWFRYSCNVWGRSVENTEELWRERLENS